MAKHNYSQYSNKKNETKIDNTPEVEVEIQNGVENDVVTEEVETPVTNVAEAEVPAETVAETNSGAVGTGVVANCAKLNVRSKPGINADVVTVLNADDKIKIDVDESTDEWFKISTVDGIEGYCMKKFVNANI